MARYKALLYDSARWDAFPRRPGDIIVTTPPKCGTTWLQTICGLLVFQTPDFPDTLDNLSPWIEMQTRSIDAVAVELGAQIHRRFFKSHTPFDGLPHDPEVTYICVGRDPRDAFISWDAHLANTDVFALIKARHDAIGLDDVADELAQGPPVRTGDVIDRFWEWVELDQPVTASTGLHTMMHHLQTFWDARDHTNVVLLHYDDLLADLEGQMRFVADALGIGIPADRWGELVEAATFDAMKARADLLAPDTTHGIRKDTSQFFTRGTRGQWHDQLPGADTDRYWSRVRALASPDLVTWTHEPEHAPVIRRTRG